MTEEELIQIALKQHWYEGGAGTPLKYIGKLVESFGRRWRRFCREINELFADGERRARMSLLVSMVGELSGILEQEELRIAGLGKYPIT